LRHEETGALEAIDRILNRGGDADDVLHEVLAVLGRLYRYVAVEFVEGDRSVVGPEVGEREREPEPPAAFPVVYQRRRIGALLVAEAREDDRPFLERVATLVSAYVLVGWDTGGVPWSPD
jgi:hypothetical protein